MKSIDLQGQEKTFQAAIDRIIPKDDFAGGWEAGVGDYIFRLLAGDCAALVPLYQQGLAALDAEARAAHGKPFAELSAPDQDDLLRRVEAGKVETDWPVAPRHFFDRLVSQAMEGYYGDPGNGGNKGGVSWRMVGFKVTG
ncbi:MAG TPA: gluconate 2-dehydrogenase subunit 3 family protein [Capsulimonadaceae bacterium]|nr:gluconate 2-dehydrogenase subunit 3 family protein [Capsulimonadaceae bacterium]